MEIIDKSTSELGRSLDDYYQDELSYMRDMGQAFSEAYPKLAPFLAREGNDPDVERLLEGFSFIASRIRQRMDNSMSEFSQDINSVMLPQLQRPIPSFSVAKFTPPTENISSKKVIERYSEVSSVPVQGTRCTFSTCYDVALYPLYIKDINLGERNGKSTIDITMQMDECASLKDINMDSLRFYINAGNISSKLYQLLFSQLADIKCYMSADGDRCASSLPTNAIKPVGFSADTSILPYPDNSMEAHQQLLEYYCYPEKYHFFDLSFVDGDFSNFEFTSLTVSLGLEKKLNISSKLTKNTMQLYCTPIANLFDMDADPVRRGNKKLEYLVKPANINQEHYSVYSIDSVVAFDDGGRSSHPLSQLYAPSTTYNGTSKKTGDVNDLYKLRVRPSVTGGVNNYISFRANSHYTNDNANSTISMRLTCTNADLPEKLRQQDIHFTGDGIAANIDVVNLHVPTKAIVAQIDVDTQWQMLSNYSANYLSFAEEKNLKQLLVGYNLPAKVDRQAARDLKIILDSIVNINMLPNVKLTHGIPIQGYKIVMNVHGDNFSNEGDMYMFFSVLSSYFSKLSNINSFSELEVHDIDCGETFHWDCDIVGISA